MRLKKCMPIISNRGLKVERRKKKIVRCCVPNIMKRREIGGSRFVIINIWMVGRK